MGCNTKIQSLSGSALCFVTESNWLTPSRYNLNQKTDLDIEDFKNYQKPEEIAHFKVKLVISSIARVFANLAIYSFVSPVGAIYHLSLAAWNYNVIELRKKHLECFALELLRISILVSSIYATIINPSMKPFLCLSFPLALSFVDLTRTIFNPIYNSRALENNNSIEWRTKLALKWEFGIDISTKNIPPDFLYELIDLHEEKVLGVIHKLQEFLPEKERVLCDSSVDVKKILARLEQIKQDVDAQAWGEISLIREELVEANTQLTRLQRYDSSDLTKKLRGRDVDRLIEHAATLNEKLTNFSGITPDAIRQAENWIERFQEKAFPYASNEELRLWIGKLRNTCSLIELEKSSWKIKNFVSPILKLPEEMLNTIAEFLNRKDLLEVAVTSKSSKPSLARSSDREKLIRISNGMPVRDLGLTEKSLLALIRRNDLRIRENKGITIKCLNLDGIRITEIRSLLDLCPEIHSLSAVGGGFKSDLASQIASYENIRELDLSQNQIGSVGAAHISKMRGLRSLNLGCNQIGNVGADHVSKMSGLTSLSLQGNRIGPEGAAHISKMGGLTRLDLSDNQIGSMGAEHISKMTGLTSLILKGWQIGPEGAAHIGKMSGLTSLDLSDNQIGDVGAAHISKMSGLMSLSLKGMWIGPEGAEHVSKMAGLTSLNLKGGQIGDVGAAHISKMRGLTSLNLIDNKIGSLGAEEISKMHGLTSLDLGWNQIGPEGVEHISKMDGLTRLTVRGSGLGPLGAEHISKMHRLRSLNLGRNDIGDVGAEHISKMDGLTSLSLRGSGLGPLSAEHISKMHRLRSLNLGHNEIGDVGAEHISKMNGLISLSLQGTRLGPVGTAHISKMREWMSLNLGQNEIDDVGLSTLAKWMG